MLILEGGCLSEGVRATLGPQLERTFQTFESLLDPPLQWDEHMAWTASIPSRLVLDRTVLETAALEDHLREMTQSTLPPAATPPFQVLEWLGEELPVPVEGTQVNSSLGVNMELLSLTLRNQSISRRLSDLPSLVLLASTMETMEQVSPVSLGKKIELWLITVLDLKVWRCWEDTIR